MPANLKEGIIKSLDTLSIAKLLTDPSGANATYGTAIDCQVISADIIAPTYKESELYANEVLLDVARSLEYIDFKLEIATLNLDLLSIIEGSVNTTVGTTPSSSYVNSLGQASSSTNYFSVIVTSKYKGSVGDAVKKTVILPKCSGKIDAGSIKTHGDHTTFSIAGKAIPLIGKYQDGTTIYDKEIRIIKYHES